MTKGILRSFKYHKAENKALANQQYHQIINLRQPPSTEMFAQLAEVWKNYKQITRN